MALHYFCRRKGPKKGPGAWPGVRSGAALPFKAKMRVITPGVKLPVAVIWNMRLIQPDQLAEAERQVAEWEPNPAECETIGGQADPWASN